jgi:hypothetical protein
MKISSPYYLVQARHALLSEWPFPSNSKALSYRPA